MELQLVAAMLVILFFILYREQRKSHREASEALRNEVNRLQQSMVAIDDRICTLSENVVVVYGKPERSILDHDPDSVTPNQSDEEMAKAVD
jgi:hypothetical protein